MPTKAVLIQLGVMLATNNVRRNIGTYVANVANSNGDVRTVSTSVLANGGTYSNNPPAGNKVTVIVTDKPVTLDITFAAGGSVSLVVSSMFVVDAEVSAIVLTNNSTTDNANVALING